jgi:hypothetical protein
MRMRWPGLLLGSALAVSGCAPKPPQACTPPRSYWHRPPGFDGLHPPIQLVGIDRNGAVYWDGKLTSQPRFTTSLKAVHAMNPAPEVFLEVEAGVPCAALEAVRDEMDRQMDCRGGGACAEGVRSIWAGVEAPPGTPPS